MVVDWIEQLVNTLATGTCTLEQAKAFLRTRAATVVEAKAYPLEHIETPVAIDLAFAEGARSSLDDFAARFGEFRSMPRAPDDFHSGEKRACYLTRDKTTVRIFAELDASNRVAKVFVDAYTSR